MIAEVLNDVGCATTRSDLSRALEAFELSLRLRRELGDMVNVADSLNNIGYALVIAEAPDEARPPLMESYALAKSLGSVRHEALAVGNLAIVSLLDGSLERARAEFAECIDLSERLGDERVALEALRGLAAVAAVAEDHERAAAISGAVDARHRAVGGVPSAGERMIENRWLRPAREAYGRAAWDAAAARGGSSTLEQAVSRALAPPSATAAVEGRDAGTAT